MCCGCFSLQADNPLELKKKAKKLCCCAVIWMIIGILAGGIGIVLLAFFAKEWNEDTWKRGVAYTGVAFLVVGVIIVGVGITICVVFNTIIDRHENRGKMNSKKAKMNANTKYPRQPVQDDLEMSPVSDKQTSPPAQQQIPQLEMIEPMGKDKTF